MTQRDGPSFAGEYNFNMYRSSVGNVIKKKKNLLSGESGSFPVGGTIKNDKGKTFLTFSCFIGIGDLRAQLLHRSQGI